MIYVNKPFLPDYSLFESYMKKIWESNILTNNGPLVKQLEEQLKNFLNVKHLFFTSNGTIAIQIALKALGIQKEVITTPFSYVATTNSILWENCKPIFADINKGDYNIDVNKIKEKISPETEAILATHVYGNPCDVLAIKKLADENNLKVIYDGAHAFDSLYEGKQLLSYGDISTCSFHATKLFHTVEGGCIITDDDEIANRIMLMRQFGHVYDEYFSIGINGKNSEFHAAMGLSMLPSIKLIKQNRRETCELYQRLLGNLQISQPKALKNTEYNYAYFPIVFESEDILLKVKSELEKININTRRYFYPSLNNLPFLDGADCSVSEKISSRVLCLPLYYDFDKRNVHIISDCIRNILNR